MKFEQLEGNAVELDSAEAIEGLPPALEGLAISKDLEGEGTGKGEQMASIVDTAVESLVEATKLESQVIGAQSLLAGTVHSLVEAGLGQAAELTEETRHLLAEGIRARIKELGVSEAQHNVAANANDLDLERRRSVLGKIARALEA